MRARLVTRAGLIKLAAALVTLYAVFFVWTCGRIVRQATRNEARSADAIIVFGAAEYFGRPSPVYRARLDHAYDLYQQGLAPLVITTGGSGGEVRFTEGSVGRDYLIARGIDDQHLIAETQGDNTAESVERVARILDTNQLHTCIAVSDPYHMFRIRRMLSSRGFLVYCSPRRWEVRPSMLALMLRIMREAASYSLWRWGLNFWQ